MFRKVFSIDILLAVSFIIDGFSSIRSLGLGCSFRACRLRIRFTAICCVARGLLLLICLGTFLGCRRFLAGFIIVMALLVLCTGLLSIL